MNSLLKVHSLLFTVTLLSAAAPAFAVSRTGNVETPRIAQRDHSDIIICCQPMIHSTNGDVFSFANQTSEIALSPMDSTGPSVLVARDWFGWERDSKTST